MRAAKKRRLYLLLTCGICLSAATGLTLAAFSSTLTYFLSPASVIAKNPAPGMTFRLGGIVQVNTVTTTITNGSPTTSFRVTDGRASIPVIFTGVLPDLFREGQGVVAIGSMTQQGTFSAGEVLAKHGASYMPRDVEQALQKAGKWNPKYGPPPAAATWNTMTVKAATRDDGSVLRVESQSMIPELGHFALALAVALAFAQGVIGIFAPGLRDPRAMRAAPALALSHFLAIGAAFLGLIYAGIVSDFTVENVADFSSSAVPLIYRISGTWGNHDGSMVLWCFILSLCGATVAAFGQNLPASLRARVLGVLGLVSGGFLLFTLTVSDPFTRLWPPPLDGAGVNPILQDPGLAFHPPVLYTGYVGFSVAFAFAIAALIEGRIDAAWGRWVRPWALLSWCFLTAGIALGSWWSYYTLGWGGYWFWDPVENAALLPWLTGTALLHCAIVVEKREALKAWTVLLAIATFSLSLSGTFLVRSGILNSVHSFAAAPDQGLFILGLLALTIGGSLLLFAIRAPVLAATGMYAPLSRESALVLNNIFLCSIAAVVFTGTLYPPFANLLFGIQLSVGAPFFNQTVLPLTAPLILAMAVGPLLAWKRAALGPALQRLWLAAGVALIVFLVVAANRHIIAALGLAGGIWVVCAALTDLAERTRLFRIPLPASLGRFAVLPRAAIGATLGHIGFGVTVLGIAGMTLATQKVIVLQPGQFTELGGYTWTLNDIHDAPGPNYAQRVADITLSENGQAFLTLHPSRRFFSAQKVITNDAAIHTNGFQDIYAVFADEPAGSNGAELRLNRHPLAPEIWFGGLIMALGGGLSLSDRRLRVGAPSRKKPAGAVA